MLTTIKTLNTLVSIINKELPGRDYSIDKCYGGYRLVANNSSRDVSYRTSKKELEVFLRGMLEAINNK